MASSPASSTSSYHHPYSHSFVQSPTPVPSSRSSGAHALSSINEFPFTLQTGMSTTGQDTSGAVPGASAAFMQTGMDFTQLMNSPFHTTAASAASNGGHAPDFTNMLVSGAPDFRSMQSPTLAGLSHGTFNSLATPGSLHAHSDIGSPAGAFSPELAASSLASGQHTPAIARTFLGMRIHDDDSNAAAVSAASFALGNSLAGEQPSAAAAAAYPFLQAGMSPGHPQQPTPTTMAQSIQSYASMLGVPFPGAFPGAGINAGGHSAANAMMFDAQQQHQTQPFSFQPQQHHQLLSGPAISPPDSPAQLKSLFNAQTAGMTARGSGKDASNHSLLGPGSVIPEEEDAESAGAGANVVPQEIVYNRPRTEVNIAAVRPAVEQYLAAGGGIGVGTGAAPEDPAGERTVVLMTARVAQKSYGAEKRFLCPPPTVMLLGSQWWTAAPGYDQHGHADFAYHPPKVTITIPGDSGDQSGALEWCNTLGQPVLDETTTSNKIAAHDVNAQPVAGRCVAKHLYINDADEKRKHVEISVRVHTAAGHQLGKFDSRPIKVISKPSKKRQSVKNLELCIHHGTTVSLFNRVRSQTVSTKYLGVSSTASSQRWHCPGTFDPVVANAGDAAACFVARTDGWDPFVIWLVEPDPAKRDQQQQFMHDQAAAEADATPIGYPPPPGVAMQPRRHVALTQTHNGTITAIPAGAQLIPVHYNQLVVLQCLTTGMVSPVMRVRKVEKGSLVTGGAEIAESTEMLGDPVSQLHKVAFEIYQPKEPQMSAHRPDMMSVSADDTALAEHPQLTPISLSIDLFDSNPGTYLACLGDVVGVHPAVEGTKRLLTPPHTPHTPTMSAAGMSPLSTSRPLSPTEHRELMSQTMPGSPLWQQQQQQQQSMPTTIAGYNYASISPTLAQQALQEPVRSLKRRATQPMLAGGIHKSSPPVKAIRKVSSLGSFAVNAAVAAAAATAAGGTYLPDSPSMGPVSASGSAWNEDVGDASVWTIVGTECVRYTFYHPGSISATNEQNNGMHYHPQLHLPPVTPVPSVHRVTISADPSQMSAQPDPSSLDPSATLFPQSTPLVMIYGENFSPDLSVWFGDRCSAQTEWRSRELIACYGPEPLPCNPDGSMPVHERREVPLLLVRSDGTIFKTGRTLIV